MMGHGYSSYRRRYCRCEICRKANLAMHRAWKDKQVPPPPGDDKHGKYTTYLNYHCRCLPCTVAASKWNAENRAKWKARKADGK